MKSDKQILFDRISFWEKYEFRKPTFEDLLENNTIGVITYEKIRKYCNNRDEVNYFAQGFLEIARDMIKFGVPEYVFLDILECKPKEKGVKIITIEEILNECLDALEKKYGKNKVNKLRKKFEI